MPKDSRPNKSHGFLYKPYDDGSRRSPSLKKEIVSSEEWEDVTCPICMESPHNAVLLLCSSHSKGCRPYMCDTSYRHSNCLDQYIKKSADGAAGSSPAVGIGSLEVRDLERLVRDDVHAEGGGRYTRASDGLNLVCPLCRGVVVGWKAEDKARRYLDGKHRGCAQDSCRYSGAYEELRKHARFVHPAARPSEVDPVRQREWCVLERQREVGDVLSSLQSSIPNATVVGDYVLEDESDVDGSDSEGQHHHHLHHHHEHPDLWTMLLFFRLVGSGRHESSGRQHNNLVRTSARGDHGNHNSSGGTGATNYHEQMETAASQGYQSGGRSSRSRRNDSFEERSRRGNSHSTSRTTMERGSGSHSTRRRSSRR